MAKKPNRILNYFKEVKSELKKVVWPSFKQVKNNTLIVIVCVLIVGAFIWILDLGFAKGWTLINPGNEAQTENVVTDPAAAPVEKTETPAENNQGTEANGAEAQNGAEAESNTSNTAE